MEEIWKDIEGYDGVYQVSNMGNVKRTEHYSFHPRGNGHYFKLPERMMTQSVNRPDSHRELLVTLTKNGKEKSFLVHRLVAQAFIPNPENKPQVNHIDGNSTNNVVTNLEWVTGAENMQHALRTGLYSQDQSRAAGMANARAVICVETGEVYKSIAEASRSKGVSVYSIQHSIKTRKPGRCGFTFVPVDPYKDYSKFDHWHQHITVEETEER